VHSQEIVKNIYLIKDKSPFWEDIEKVLRGVNAKVSTFEGEAGPEAISRQAPDLAIMAAHIHQKISSMTQKVPKLIIMNSIGPGAVIQESTDENFIIVGWPLEEHSFLELTSKLLAISKRRQFQTLIRIFPKRLNTGFVGKSEDFSLTGLAFKAEQELQVGEGVILSFFVMEVQKSIKLEAEITRRAVDPSDGSLYYGARFVNLSPENNEIVEKFVCGTS